ncbi:hypothetical protein LCL85_00035 [Vibrio alginolyticus]|nr:hypothetical protein [Vibrio alginolyticus]
MNNPFIFIFILLFSHPSFANFIVSPTQVEVDSKVKVVSYTIENKTPNSSAYKIEVFERQLLPSGEEVLLETKDLRAFPSRVIIESGKKKRIKVMYIGKRNLTEERPYRINFIQDDKDVSKDLSNRVNVQFEFFTSLYIQPKNSESNLETELVKRDNKWMLHIQNTGTKHHILNGWKIDFGTPLGSVDMPPVNVLANSQVYLPVNKNLNNTAKAFTIRQN